MRQDDCETVQRRIRWSNEKILARFAVCIVYGLVGESFGHELIPRLHYLFILLFIEIGSKNSRTFVDDVSEWIRAFGFHKVLKYRKLAKFSSISNLCKFSKLSKFGIPDNIRKCRRMSFYVEKGGENERWWCCARDWLWLNWMVEILTTRGFIFLKKVS